MKSLEIHGSTGDSALLVGERLENLTHYLPPAARTVIITDTTVRGLYGERFPPCDVIEIGTGEDIKTLETVAYIFDQLVRLEADRTVFIVGIGGGIVCDTAGFVASTYMRGCASALSPPPCSPRWTPAWAEKTVSTFPATKIWSAPLTSPNL
ncbi:3-dehydroquinate synthase [Desulfonema ishimotonii]|uniref:3-dehydroquinate synthase n=1 Tax=Desulfonema ishimotonii TaxID=45657 RepID=A0A401FWX0_9BACT|nr:3-dehydroquinate synthase [Desulfonema ishimotonii]